MKKLLLILLCLPLLFSCGENQVKKEYTPCYCTSVFESYYEKSPMKDAAMDKTVPSKNFGNIIDGARKDNKEEMDQRSELWKCLEKYEGHYDYYTKCKGK